MFKINQLNELKNKRSIEIIVKTNKKKTMIVDFDYEKNAYIIEVSAQPENNKANIEIIKYFQRLTKKKVNILKGLTSKKKTIIFTDY